MLGPLLLLLALRDSLVLGFHSFPGEQRYEVVYPRKLHTQHKRDTQSKYPDLVHYGLEFNGRPLELQLQKTEDLLTNNYTETHYLDDGTPVTTSPEWQDHCYYQGHVKNDNNSQVSLSVCHGLSGFIMTQEQKLLIEPLNKTEDGAHAVYTYQAQEAPKTCGVDDTMYNDSIQTKISFSISNAEKTAFLRARKYIELYIVADYSMFIKYKSNKALLRERVYGIVNFVNLVYKPLNIFVALTGLEIWDTGDQFQVVTLANTILNDFSKWRENDLLPRKPNDNAQFLTHTDFDGATVGLAWVSTMCQDFHSTGVIQDHSIEYVPVGATIAHEMGHNLGMDHDGISCLCSSKSCIMAPTLSYNTPREFSSCSHQNYQDFLLKNMPLCMRDMPDKKDIVSAAFCGNKFTEVGEECDCGTVEECTNKCCDAKTCKVKENAQCAEGECCSDCKLKTAGSVCRAATDDCDLSDMCDGTSATCPSDRFRINGFPCRNGEGHCYNGKCPTHQSQCLMHWGQGWVAGSDTCFSLNTRGREGFCRHNGVNVRCPVKDVNCGVLFCSRASSRPVHTDCNTRNPPVLVKDGTRCGEESVCQSGSCTSIDAAYKSRDCSAKCPKNAVCDHELKCHCEEGWAAPNCDTRASQVD
ncbi:PREDICTED: zinc metalloproteinase-disintegrin-like batroxstatin-2 [Nanorana parkeri]|uniref:zinc metalloproteinase-disintegrin-like batroxstatin-2 n=1 Tax=Nanorana parkeri TaxID=125878 RepID=UPI0008550C9A|nr:PREDICTED: zinc metalloproteinase-disintegrin-like batroxstatin-2 [Nanorana parkeri]